MKKIYLIAILYAFFLNKGNSQTTYYNDVADIFYNTCTGCHHPGGSAPISLMNYNDCQTNATSIVADLNSGKMPPWLPDTANGNVRFMHEQIISLADKNLILKWVNDGALRGDSTLAPTAPFYDDYAYQLCPEPTMILKMAPYTLSHDEGYDCFVLPTNLPTDRYLRAFEIVPGNASIVKSVFAGMSVGGLGLVGDTTGNCLVPAVTGYLGAYSPNAAATVWPGKAPLRCGMLIPANSDINLQIHYSEGCLGQSDSTQIRLYFYPDTATNVRKISTTTDYNNFLIFSFPNTVTTLSDSLPIDSSRSILGIYPYAHGVTTSIEVNGVNTTPKIPLIRINKWDMDWSSFYFYKKLVKFPSTYYVGAKSVLDNTTNNPNNPYNPPQLILYSQADTGEVQTVTTQWLRYQEGDENIDIEALLKCDTLLVCKPGVAGTIVGSSSICQGQSGVSFSVPNIGNAETYSWAYSGTGATINGNGNEITIDFSASATTGNLTVFGVNECGVGGAVSPSKALTISIGDPVDSAGTIAGDTAVCTGQTGVVYSVPSITGATNYSWNYSGTGVTITGTGVSVTIDFTDSATSGDLTVMGKNDCNNGASSVAFPISVFTVPAIPTITALPDCGSTELISSSSAGTYLWGPGGETTQRITVTASGSYYVAVAAGGNCSSTSLVESVSVAPLPTITNVQDGTRCGDGEVTLSATASSGLPSWYADSTGGTALATALSYTTTSLSATKTYYVEATENGCSSPRTAVVATVSNGPTATVGGNESVCYGKNGIFNVELTGTAPWNFTYGSSVGSNSVTGITTASYTVAAAPGTYTVSTVSDASGCANINGGSGSVIISVSNPIVVSNITKTCNGGFYTVEFDITGGDSTSYEVNGDSGLLANKHYTSGSIVSGGAYSFEVTDADNCSPVPVNGSEVCGCGSAANIDGGGIICGGNAASIDIVLTGTAPWKITYAIDGVSQTEVSGITTSPYTFTTNVTGDYTMVSVEDASCKGSIGGTATVTDASPTANVSGGGSICIGDSINLSFNLTNGTPPWSFTYSDGTTTSASISSIFVNQTISVAKGGTYKIVSMSTNACPGIGEDSAVVILNPLPTIGVVATPSETICSGAEVTLTGQGGNTYVWSGGVIDGQAFVVSTDKTYTVTGTDGNGCVNTASKSIVVKTGPVIIPDAIPNSAAVCKGASITLSGSSPGITDFTWTGGVTDGQSFVPTATQTYTVTAKDANNCTGSAFKVVSVFSLPNVGILVSPSDTICIGKKVTLTGTGADSYIWSDGVLDGVAFSPTETKTYTLVGKGDYSCTKTITKTITIDPCNGGVGISEDENRKQVLYIYPNPSEGIFNLSIKNANFKELALSVVNMVGKEVFQAMETNNGSDYYLEINLNNLAKGIYFLRIATSENSWTEKLIIQ